MRWTQTTFWYSCDLYYYHKDIHLQYFSFWRDTHLEVSQMYIVYFLRMKAQLFGNRHNIATQFQWIRHLSFWTWDRDATWTYNKRQRALDQYDWHLIVLLYGAPRCILWLFLHPRRLELLFFTFKTKEHQGDSSGVHGIVCLRRLHCGNMETRCLATLRRRRDWGQGWS